MPFEKYVQTNDATCIILFYVKTMIKGVTEKKGLFSGWP